MPNMQLIVPDESGRTPCLAEVGFSTAWYMIRRGETLSFAYTDSEGYSVTHPVMDCVLIIHRHMPIAVQKHLRDLSKRDGTYTRYLHRLDHRYNPHVATAYILDGHVFRPAMSRSGEWESSEGAAGAAREYIQSALGCKDYEAQEYMDSLPTVDTYYSKWV